MAESQSSDSELMPDPVGGGSVKEPSQGAMGSNENPGTIIPPLSPVPPADGSDSMKSAGSVKTVGDSSKQYSLMSKTQVDSPLKEFPIAVSLKKRIGTPEKAF